MAKEAPDRQSLLALVTETLLRFPPQKDCDNARSFRVISVDYLEGRITHPQFGFLYAQEKTAEQITDGIIDILHRKPGRMQANAERMGEALSERWHL